jgi:hypothetical protein
MSRGGWLLAVVVLVGCPAKNPDQGMRPMDAASFRQLLQCASTRLEGSAADACRGRLEDARRIEKIRIEPTGKDSARYVVTLNNTSQKSVVYAEYPGKITDELTAAGIAYEVKARD